MSIAAKFKGTGVAIITPFKQDGTVDTTALFKHTEHLIENGVDYLVVLGTTSEAPVLDNAERVLVTNTILDANKARLPVVLGIGGNNTQQLIKQIENTDFNGVDAILSVAPYYNKPTQRGLYAHYAAIASASPLPLILYNVPGRTSSNINAETALRLANDFANVIAIKEASGNMDQIMALLANKPSGFEVISGDDALTFPMIALGGGGVISVAANAFPKAFSDMVRFALEGDYEASKKLHFSMLRLIHLLFVEGNPAGVKALMHIDGKCENKVRLPLVEVSESTFIELKQAWKEFLNPKL